MSTSSVGPTAASSPRSPAWARTTTGNFWGSSGPGSPRTAAWCRPPPASRCAWRRRAWAATPRTREERQQNPPPGRPGGDALRRGAGGCQCPRQPTGGSHRRGPRAAAPEPTEEEPQHLCLDKAYDMKRVEDEARGHGYTPHIRRIGEEKRATPEETHPARRWVAERTFAWLKGFRAIRPRPPAGAKTIWPCFTWPVRLSSVGGLRPSLEAGCVPDVLLVFVGRSAG